MPERDLLTPVEHAALSISRDLSNHMRNIIYAPGYVETNANHDWAEAAQAIHVLQNMIMAQAAGRAYPEEYRLLGRTLGRS